MLRPNPSKRILFLSISLMSRTLRRHHSITPDKIRNFLFLQYEAPLGSVVHATPLFESLKRTIPDAHITVAASKKAASVLDNNPFVDRCVVTADPFANLMRAAREVRSLLHAVPSGPCCIVTTIGNQRARLALLSLFAGKAVRAGYTLAPELYDLPLSFIPEHGQIESNLDILRSLGHETAFCEPRVFFTKADTDSSSHSLGSIGIRPDAPRIAFVTQNSGGQRNQWKPERFQQAITELSRLRGAAPVFVGTAADAAAIEALRASLPDAGISLAGKTTVPQLAAVLAHCDLAVSLDTGTFHVARAVGLPGVVIAPAWQNPREWLPVNHPRYRVLRGPSITTTPAGYCIDEIGVEQVIAAASELLKLYPASLESRAERVRESLTDQLVIST